MKISDEKAFHITELCVRLLMLATLSGFVFGLDPFVRQLDPEQWTHHAFPMKPENFPFGLAAGIDMAASVLPAVIVALLNKFYWKKRYRTIVLDIVLYVWGMTLAVFSGLILCELIKRLYGLPRPAFLSYCTATDDKDLWFMLPHYPTDAPAYPEEGASCCSGRTTCGRDDNNDHTFCNQYFKIFEEFPLVPPIPDCHRMVSEYTDAALKTGKVHLDRLDDLQDARMSFPSGHTTTTFTFFLFGALYISHGFMNVRSVYLNSTWYFLTLVFMFMPIWVSLSRTQVYKHHLTDVIAGVIIAVVTSLLSFRIYYPLNFIQPPMINLLTKPESRVVDVLGEKSVSVRELAMDSSPR